MNEEAKEMLKLYNDKDKYGHPPVHYYYKLNLDIIPHLLDYINNLQHNWNELKKCIKDEIERTNEIIKEDCDMLQMNNIRKMLNEDRECWLYKISELEEGGNNER